MSRDAAILITLIAYKVILIGIGLLSQRRTRDGEDYFLGGRQLGPGVAALSASASSSSVWTLLGVSGAAYRFGLSAVWIFPACVGGFLFNWYVLAPALRRHSRSTGALTVTEVLAGRPGERLGRSLDVLASAIVLVSLTTYVAAQFQGAGKTFAETFGLGLVSSILLGSGIVLLYTLLGGFWAVSLTDSLQGLVMAAACLALPIICLGKIGGLGGLVDGLRAVPLDGYQSLVDNAVATGGIGFVLGLLGIGLGYPGQPHVVNRFMALREGDAAIRTGRRIAVGWAILVYAGMLLLGWCGRILLPALSDHEAVFIEAANSYLGPVVAGVMLAAVLSAIMSTADSQLLVAASAVSHDLRRGAGKKSDSLSRSRLVVLLICVLATAAALLGTQAIFRRVLFAWTAMGAAFGPLLIITVLRGPVSPGRRLAAMALGFTLSVLFYSLPATRGGPVERILPFAAAFAVGLSRKSKRQDHPHRRAGGRRPRAA